MRTERIASGAPVAAIDLGTNTALCLVARVRADGGVETLEELCLTPRLGAGLAATGALDPAAIERALEALRTFAACIAAHGIAADRVRAVGTACLRRARDGRPFAERARNETGIALEIVSEEEEARLGERAIAAAGAGPDAVVIDVGGGSTEVACPDLGLRVSLPIGAVLATEAHATESSATEAQRAAAESALADDAARRARVLPARAAADRPVWAIGGTAVNLGACARGLERFDPHAVEGVTVAASAVGELARRIARATPAERLRFPIEPTRADILPAGLAILDAVLDRLGAHELRVSGRGLRHGIVAELLGG